jgi:two-component sensor histidine kinase
MKRQVNYIHFYMQMSHTVVTLRHFNDTKMQQRERQTRILSLPCSRLLLYRSVTEVETDCAVYSDDWQAYFHILIRVG